MPIDPVKLEKLKVWFAVFGVLIEAWKAGEYTDAQVLVKLAELKLQLDLEVGRPQ